MTLMAIFERNTSIAPAILTPQSGDLLQSTHPIHLKIMHSQSRQTPDTTLNCGRRGHETLSGKSPARVKTYRSKRRKRGSEGGFHPLFPPFPSVAQEIKIRRPVGLNSLHPGLDLIFVFTSAFSLQPSTFRMAPPLI
jgi:hypothetical protein